MKRPPTRSLTATLGALFLSVMGHADHFPLWVTGSVCAAIAARLYAERRGLGLPRRSLRLALTLIALVAVLAAYRTLNGIDAGTALLALMAALKLGETRLPRDQAVLIFIGYFLCLSSLLYDQSLPRFLYALAVAWLLTAALATSQRPGAPALGAADLKLSARLMAFGLPIAVVLFLFVPRIEGRFWALPAHEARALTGIGDEMSPGDLNSLATSDDPAFRVWFHGPKPPAPQRYWRVRVLEDFDGRTWRRHGRAFDLRSTVEEPEGAVYAYRVALEPTNRAWLVALDHVISWPNEIAIRDRSGELSYFDRGTAGPARITSLLSYEARSAPVVKSASPLLAQATQIRNLSLPDDAAPRSRALARELHSASSDPADYVRRVLRRFHDDPYRYTLKPPPLAGEPVDTFLFETRAGFCEHYASAFTLLMRAAGIPARVVTGYVGGEDNEFGDYLLIRQSSAHAWSEVWLDGPGWVRVDPTAAVAPERIDVGLNDPAAVQAGAFFAWPRLARVRMLIDALRTAWLGEVLGYSTEAQASLLNRLGLSRLGRSALAAALGLGLTLAALALAILLALEWKRPPRDAALALWAEFCARLARAGLGRLPAEGPLDFARRVIAARPAWRPAVEPIVASYVALRYLGASDRATLAKLKGLVRAFHAR